MHQTGDLVVIISSPGHCAVE